MRFFISMDELYPYYTLDNTETDKFYARLAEERPGERLELTKEEYADYLRVKNEFYRWQDRIHKAYKW